MQELAHPRPGSLRVACPPPPTIPEVPAARKLRHSARSRGIHAPLPPTPTISEIPPAPKLRHSARSRGIHAPCPHHSRSTPSTQTSSFRAQSRNPCPLPPPFPKYPQHPNFVIPRTVAESISACQRISQRSQRPLHSTMDTATSRSMTVLYRVTVCAGTDDVVGRATASPPPTRSPSLRTPPVITEVECQGRWLLRLLCWQAKMDSATARGMTKFGFGGYFGNDRRRMPEDRDAFALPTPSYCAKSQYP